MKLSVQVIDPAGNITLLVTTPVPREDYRAVAGSLLSIPELRGEQVGFVTQPLGEGVIRLEMMGGEFCGNALRSVGLYYAVRQGFRRERRFPVEISGCDRALTVQVNPLTGQVWAEMPSPREIVKCTLFGEPARAVLLPGIVHGISQAAEPMEEEAVRRALQGLCADYDSPAAGVMFWRFREKSMTPAVYVKDTDSLYFESSCASGSTAVAAWNALGAGKDGTHRLEIRQPGGVIATAASVRNGAIQRIDLGGEVLLGPSYDVEF